MTPEEFERGARIDEVTNVFTMGRAIAVFRSDGTLDLGQFRGCKPLYDVMVQACQPERRDRFTSMKAFHSLAGRAWKSIVTRIGALPPGYPKSKFCIYGHCQATTLI